MSRAQPISEPTDSEETTIRNGISKVVVCSATSGHTTKLHVPHPNKDNTPACNSKRRHNGNSPTGEKDTEYKEKDLAVYPKGWADYCLYCVEWWRENAE